ncbi:MAG: hypothetical protein AAF791_08550, partial [Bacteroidota bacterium]
LGSQTAPMFDADGAYLGEVPVEVSYGGGVSGPVVPGLARAIAMLASGLLGNRKAELLTEAVVRGGLATDPVRFRAVASRDDAQLDELLGLVNWGRAAEIVADGAADVQPGLLACLSDPGASLPLLGTGALLGIAAAKLFNL